MESTCTIHSAPPDCNPLYLLQKKALRLICQKGTVNEKFSTAKASQMTGILPLPTLASYSASQLAFQIINNNCPAYFKSLFIKKDHPHKQYKKTYKLPSSSSHNKLNHFMLTSFNSLPIKIRQSSKSQFKASLKLHLLTSHTEY